MYKLRTKLPNVQLIVVRRLPNEGALSLCVLHKHDNMLRRRYSTVTERTACPPPRQPPKKTKKLLWGLAGATLVFGSAVVYARRADTYYQWLRRLFMVLMLDHARGVENGSERLATLDIVSHEKWGSRVMMECPIDTKMLCENMVGWYRKRNNPELREWVAANAPWANDVITVVYQEKSGLGPWILQQYSSVTGAIGGALFGKEGVLPEKRIKRASQDLSVDPKSPEEKFYLLPKPSLAPHFKEEVKKETPQVECATVLKVESSNAVEPPIVTKDIVYMEKCLHEFTKSAIDNYNKAIEVYESYNDNVGAIVEAGVYEMDKRKFEILKNTVLRREAVAATAHEAAKKVTDIMDQLTKELNSNKMVPADAAAITRRHIKVFKNDLDEAKAKFNKAKENAFIADRYWKRVEEARTNYIDELQTLFPTMDICAKKLDLSSGDPDVLLVYTMKQVLRLQKELIEAQTVAEEKLRRIIASKDTQELIDSTVAETLKKERINLEQEFLKKSLNLSAQYNKQLKDQLKQQIDMHQEILNEKLELKEKEVMKTFDRSVSERVEQERVEFKKQLAEVTGKLQGIEAALQSRAQAEAMARRSQSLWAAGEALLAACRRPTATVAVASEISAIEKAADGKDELVKTVVSGIPPEVREKGIVTEHALRENFLKMEKTAMRLALVSQEGASLPVYFLSWLQSLILFAKIKDIPKTEIDNLPTDFSKMDTYDILQRARYYMDRNDLTQTLRYVNLLTGASRSASLSWREAATNHLETKQAAEAVMAHAASAGLTKQ